MYNKSFGNKKRGGYKGGNPASREKRGGDRGGRFNDRGPREMHPATCEKCGTRCEVPFRPNGRKPVFCKNCFVRDEGAAPKRFGNDRPERSERSSSDVTEQLRIINNKLDAIMASLDA